MEREQRGAHLSYSWFLDEAGQEVFKARVRGGTVVEVVEVSE